MPCFRCRWNCRESTVCPLEIPLNEKEKNALLASADQLKAVIEKLTLN